MMNPSARQGRQERQHENPGMDDNAEWVFQVGIGSKNAAATASLLAGF